MKRQASKLNSISTLTAKQFMERLITSSAKTQRDNLRFYQGKNKLTKSLGSQMAAIFRLSKEFILLPLIEIEKLLKSNYYEARIGAVSIMDFQARSKKISKEQKKELFDLYIRCHDRIDNWDLVDRSAPYVIGGYLADKPRAILYKLAKSKNVWERRTAIVSTYFFIRQDEVDDTFELAQLLINDKEESMHKAIGSWIREAGKRDERRLIQFLDKNKESMPRVMLRYAIEKLNKKLKDKYMKRK
ncbi:MAG TPA: DNA alkylation repair protein [Bacteroidia bacterium]|nr:DNA alkylation repair protein [Bacteroidia bacterium]